MKSQVAKQEKLELVQGNWYNILKKISERKGRVAAMADLIKAKNSLQFEELWQNGAYVSTTLDYSPENPVILIADNSDLLNLKNAKKAVEAHSSGQELYTTQAKYDAHLKQAEKESKKSPEDRSLFILPKRDTFNITSQNYFDVLRFLAQDPKQAEKYLNKLSEKGIDSLRFYLVDKDYVDKQSAPFERQLWSRRLDGRSELFGYFRYLVGDLNRAVSVSPLLGEARGAQKISEKSKVETYTPKQLASTLKRLKITGLEENILNDLRKNY